MLSLTTMKSFEKSIVEEETTCVLKSRIFARYDTQTTQDQVKKQMKSIELSNNLLKSCSIDNQKVKSGPELDHRKIFFTSLIKLKCDVKKLTSELSDQRKSIKKIEIENCQLVKKKKILQNKLREKLESQNKKTVFCNWCFSEASFRN